MIIRWSQICTIFLFGFVLTGCQIAPRSGNEAILPTVVASPTFAAGEGEEVSIPTKLTATPELIEESGALEVNPTATTQIDSASPHISLHVADSFHLPAPECSFEDTHAPDMLFYTCPEQTEFAGLWVVGPTFQSEAVQIAVPSYYNPIAVLSPNGEYLAFRNTRTLIQVVSTENWHPIVEITVSEEPTIIQYAWLPNSSGLAVTYPSGQTTLEIFYLSGEREDILSGEVYENRQQHIDGGILLLNMWSDIDTQNELFYTISDPDNHPPKFQETYIYDWLEKQSSLLIFNDDSEKYIRNVFNSISSESELGISFWSTTLHGISEYYIINTETQAHRLVYPLNPDNPFTVVGEFLEDNIIAVVSADNKHKLVDLNNGTETETGVTCTEVFHTQWSSEKDFVIIFCEDSVWLFDLHTEVVTKVYDQGLEFWKSGIWDWYQDGQQMFAIQNDDTVSLIYFR